jgi:hypothetical protein
VSRLTQAKYVAAFIGGLVLAIPAYIIRAITGKNR